MSSDFSGFRERHHPRSARSRRMAPHKVQRLRDPQKWLFCIVVAAFLVAALSVLQFSLAQATPPHALDIISTFAIVGLAGIFAGLFSYVAIRLVNAIAGHDLVRVLNGDEPISIRWCYILILGITIGVGIALSTGLAAAVL